jgi:hypothetical protein
MQFTLTLLPAKLLALDAVAGVTSRANAAKCRAINRHRPRVVVLGLVSFSKRCPAFGGQQRTA